MFRKSALTVTLLAALTLGGCLTPGQTPGQVISDAQKYAVTACGFLATITTITDIFLSGNPAYSTAESIGQAICAAVTPVKLAGRKMAMVPRVGGVAVHGRFVQ